MTELTGSSGETGHLVSWEEGIADDKKYHIAYISADGITFVRKMKSESKWMNLVGSVEASPDEATDLLLQLPQTVQIAPEELARVTFAGDLNQLVLFHQDGSKTKIPEGEGQIELFEAIEEYFGGDKSEEEADAWSVIKSPLVTLSIIAVIGGFLIHFTTICDPNFVAEGRRRGMSQLLNSVGLWIGPVWMSCIVGGLAALVVFLTAAQLINRPIRQILSWTD